MPNGKPNVQVAKGALAGAAATFSSGDKNYRAEEAFRDALRTAKKAGCTEEECARIVGNAVVDSVDRFGGPVAISSEPPQAHGLEKTVEKLSARRLFHAGFVVGASRSAKR